VGQKIWDRKNAAWIEEKVLGQAWIEWAYTSRLGRAFSGPRSFQKLFSRLMGLYESSGVSKSQIPSFLQDYELSLDEFEVPEGGYRNFNEFFVRKYKPGLRQFPSAAEELGAPAEGRVTAFEITSFQIPLVIKGVPLSLAQLVRQSLRPHFLGGTVLVFRLCPLDYHCFHFPDSGSCGPTQRVSGKLESVNPLSLSLQSDVFLQNERHITAVETQNFGELFLVEVGALGVGKIRQHYNPSQPVLKGQLKGDFLFGGSTVVLITSSKVKIDRDLISNTQHEFETLVRLGERIGTRA
jgi:phosphatidylserine decarboxylase